jgi:uroporphyrinogen decarboxylase
VNQGAATRSERFLKACRREETDCTPIWIMRQAGRYLPEYRELRKKHAMLEMAKTPELAARVTLLPLQELDLDAAILFSDIMVPLEGMGVSFHIEENVGPIVEAPIRSAEQIRALRPFDAPRDVPFVLEAIRQVRRELNGRVPLIGFAGAPFTLASYLLEGRSPRRFRWTKALMLEGSPWWDDLMRRLTDTTIAYLQAQVEAGAQALQLFDSWAGALSPPHYARFVLPHTRRIFQALRSAGIPLIHFGTETATLLELMAEAGPDVVGADWRMPLDEAWRRMGHERAIQGNLDPAVLFAPWESVQKEARDVLDRAAGRSGHIFNLGHGILPETPVENVRRLVDFVHDASRRILT